MMREGAHKLILAGDTMAAGRKGSQVCLFYTLTISQRNGICSHPGVCMRKGPVNSRCVHFQSHKKYLASGSCSCKLVSAGGAKTSLGKKGHVVQRWIFDVLELYEATCPAVVSQV